MEIETLLETLTLEEKAKLVSGKDFWTTQGFEHLGVPSIMMTDGPHGLRKQIAENEGFDTSGAVPATVFPSASTTSCSFSREALFKMGETIAKECVKEDVSVLLGPGLNIKRSPVCGRNFEYYSEDPILSGKMAASMTRGLQSLHVGACLKHYCANNQENARQINDAIVDDRALNEIYLKGFKIAVKESNPYAIMCSYNKINGTYACENEVTLKEKLREEYGYDGVLLTDWGAMDDRVAALKATLDLEMPGSGNDNTNKVIKAVKEGKLDIETLNASCRRILELAEKSKNEVVPCDMEANHKAAEEVGNESIVLLKNDDDILPLTKEEKVLMVGNFFTKLRFMGGGSSLMIPYQVTNVNEALDERKIAYEFVLGYDLENKLDEQALVEEAVTKSKEAKKVVLYIGLTDKEESEGYDRKNIDLPEVQRKLVEEIAKVNDNIIVVLFGGSVVALPFKDKVKAILKVGLPGEAGGRSIANVLYGDVNPSGRLAESYIEDWTKNPSYAYFGQREMTYYKESCYVGYRYYNTVHQAVTYPFGYGLSYTTFAYRDLALERKGDQIRVSLYVKNTGKRPGKEVVQLYFASPSSEKGRPSIELLDFDKVALEAGEEKQVSFVIPLEDLCYYHVEQKKLAFENGLYRFLICKNAEETLLEGSLTLEREDALPLPEFYRDYLCLAEGKIAIRDEDFQTMLQREIPVYQKEKRYSINSTFTDIRKKWFGRFLYKTIMKKVNELLGEFFANELEQMMADMPIRCLSMFTNGALGYTKIEGIADILNNHWFRGLRKLASKK